MKKIVLLLAMMFAFNGLPGLAAADTIPLKLALMKAGGQDYFSDLLRESLAAIGHQAEIQVLGHLPQKRIIYMVEQGALSMVWLIQNQERDAKYDSLPVNITNGLIGRRILLIPKGAEKDYANVNTLEDFRKLNKIGAFGKGWFDVAVWQANDLPYIERDGDWRNKIYRQIADGNRGVDYFSRGVNEILEEAKTYDYLAIEPRLMLIYDRDYRLYLSKPTTQYKELLTKALTEAKNSGLMDRLIRKHWATEFEALNVDNRVKIHLPTPKN